MFYYILDKLKKIWFTYGDISTGSYPLDTIDSINTADGSIDIHSAVFLVINGVIISLSLSLNTVSLISLLGIRRAFGLDRRPSHRFAEEEVEFLYQI